MLFYICDIFKFQVRVSMISFTACSQNKQDSKHYVYTLPGTVYVILARIVSQMLHGPL